MDEAATWELLKRSKKIIIAKGKKVQTWNPQSDSKVEILKQAMGPSGNLRAPTIRTGEEFVIGFNAELYKEWLG